MEKCALTSSKIQNIFRLKKRRKSLQSLYNAEERGEIPKAARASRGQVQVRNWYIDQVPSIGSKFGYLKKNLNQIVISTYIQKGGVFKTSSTYNFARTFALNGIKTLIIGQDSECSITDVISPQQETYRLEDTNPRLGLYHYFAEKAELADIIEHTELPTLDIIPETHDLTVLDKWINRQPRREYIYEDKLIPNLSDYDVIIFDNCPSWNHLIENSIVCSNIISLPLGCNLLAYNACETNLSSVFDFQEDMKLGNQKMVMFSTVLERNSLSQQINAQYLSKFKDYIIPIPIRKSVKGEEALLNQQTTIEYAPNSPLAEDYYGLIRAFWAIATNEKSIEEVQKDIDNEVGE